MLNPSIVKKISPMGGFGLFAQYPIEAGELIWRHNPKAKKFDPRFPEKLPSLTYRIGDFYYAETDDSHYMNHSCEPNCWFQGDEESVAIRLINPGEEVTYDYSFVEIPFVDSDKPWTRKWDCNCGAADCRGKIGSKDLLNPSLLARYKGHIPSWTLECIEMHKRLGLK